MRVLFNKINLLVLLLTVATVKSSAQHSEKILQSAKAWADANNSNDYETMADYTSPRLIAFSGGRDKWIKNRIKTLEKMPAVRDSLHAVAIAEMKARSSNSMIVSSSSSGPTTKRNLTFEKPGKIHTAGGELYCVVPFSNRTAHRDKIMVSYGSVLAVSADQGATWTFAEVTYAKDDFHTRFFPTFDKNAIKHKYKAPTVEDNPESSKSSPAVAYKRKITLSEWTQEARSDSRLLPRYGGIPKTKRQIAADKSLVDAYLKEHGTPRKASDRLIAQGFSLLYSQDLKTAMYRFNQAWLLDSTNADVYWGYGGVYHTLGDVQSALNQYDEGLLIDRQNSKILTDKATVYMAQYEAKSDKNQLIKAIDLFNESYAIDPKNQNTLYKISVAYFQLGDCTNAKKYFKECKALGGNVIKPAYANALRKRCQ